MKPKLILTIFAICAPILAFPITVRSEANPATASPSMELIKENVKKRIQEVVKVKGDRDISRQKSALFGSLESIAVTTLSINTESGLKLASTSATTRYYDMPDNKPLKLEDLPINNYVIALGWMHGQEEVLDADQILTQKMAPAPSANQSFFGLVNSYDPKTYALTLTNPATQTVKDVTIGRKTEVYAAKTDGSSIQIKRTTKIPPGSNVLMIFTPSLEPEGEEKVLSVLVNNPAMELEIVPPTPLPTPLPAGGSTGI